VPLLAERAAEKATGPLTPSRLVKIVMRPMTAVLNPLVSRLAGRRHFCMAAQIRHVGKCSGRAYVTPAGARVVGDVALIPRTFGNQSDWSKNRRREARPDSWPGPRSARRARQLQAARHPQYLRLRVLPDTSAD